MVRKTSKRKNYPSLGTPVNSPPGKREIKFASKIEMISVNGSIYHRRMNDEGSTPFSAKTEGVKPTDLVSSCEPSRRAAIGFENYPTEVVVELSAALALMKAKVLEKQVSMCNTGWVIDNGVWFHGERHLLMLTIH